MTRECLPPVTRDVAVSGSALDALTPDLTTSPFTTIRTNGADGPRPIPDGGSLPGQVGAPSPVDVTPDPRNHATARLPDGQGGALPRLCSSPSQESFKMTNQSLDIQPALRSFNVLVRGGRLTVNRH